MIKNYESHNFYCINCGKKGLNIYRNKSHFHKKFHRKKLYCPWCKQYVNHIECYTIEDEEKFLEDFKNGVYKDEAEESLAVSGLSGVG